MIDRAVDLMQGAIIGIEDRSDQAVRVIQEALIDIEDRKRELDVILSKLNNTFCEKTANLIDVALKPCNTNECAIRARSLATKTTGEENEKI